jgi:Fe-S-cluster-containing hydrogenase component 2
MRILTEEEFTQYDDEEIEPINCPHCEKRGYLVQLGPKILMPNEPRPEDYDQFLECPTCYWICPIHEIPKEETIKDSIETQDSPYEDKLKLESAHKRRTRRKVARHINKNVRQTNDPDILREIRQHGSDNVKILVDTNP